MTREQAIAVYTSAAKIHAMYSHRTQAPKEAKAIAVAMENYIGQLGSIPAECWK
jgi:hypothetical protein